MWLWVQDFTGEQSSIKHKIFFLGICGPTCSGKTKLARSLVRIYKNLKPYLFSLDMYYKNLPENVKAEDYNFDSPSALDLPLILKNLKKIERREVFKSPLYDFKKHRRISYLEVDLQTNFILIEGIFLLFFRPLRQRLNFSVYLELSEEEILKRRISRDMKSRGSSLNFVKKQMERFVFYGNRRYVEKYKKYASLVLPSSLEFREKVEIVSEEIKKNLLKYWNEF